MIDMEIVKIYSNRRDVAQRYVLSETNLLFIAEAPPFAVERFFYSENVQTIDWLWFKLMQAI